MTETIQLRVVIDDDGFTHIVDQHGRKLTGVRSIERLSSFDDATKIKIEVLEFVGGDVTVNRRTKNENK